MPTTDRVPLTLEVKRHTPLFTKHTAYTQYEYIMHIVRRDSCSERSHLSVIGVPRLGCRKCAAIPRDEGRNMHTHPLGLLWRKYDKSIVSKRLS